MAATKERVSTHPVRSLSATDERLVGRLRQLCLRFPEANERISHGEPTWFAGKDAHVATNKLRAALAQRSAT